MADQEFLNQLLQVFPNFASHLTDTFGPQVSTQLAHASGNAQLLPPGGGVTQLPIARAPIEPTGPTSPTGPAAPPASVAPPIPGRNTIVPRPVSGPPGLGSNPNFSGGLPPIATGNNFSGLLPEIGKSVAPGLLKAK